MMRAGKIAVYIAGGLVLAAGLRADDAVLPGNPYSLIVARNVFGLNPPPPVTASVQDANPSPKITPNGIMSIFGQWQVLFKTAGVGKSGKPPEDKHYMLAEGQRQDDIEVVKIDEKADVITFDNHGDIQELPLASPVALSTPAMNPNLANGFAANGYNGGNRFNQSGNQGGNFGGRNGGENGGNDFNDGTVNGSDSQNIPTSGDDSGQQLAMTSEDQGGMMEVQRLQYQRQLEALR
jgi:hypothetical protein